MPVRLIGLMNITGVMATGIQEAVRSLDNQQTKDIYNVTPRSKASMTKDDYDKVDYYSFDASSNPFQFVHVWSPRVCTFFVCKL